MMEAQMVEFELDMDRMPLGKISKAQITKGFTILQEIDQALKQGGAAASGSKLAALSSRFYTAIPHAFGMRIPPVIGSAAAVQVKLDMLQALGDLEIAATMLKSAEKEIDVNPIDANFEKLRCAMEALDHASDEFRMVEKYVRQTHGSTHSSYKLEVEDVFRIVRYVILSLFLSLSA
jgi:poly [ADP-ribose] polymerase